MWGEHEAATLAASSSQRRDTLPVATALLTELLQFFPKKMVSFPPQFLLSPFFPRHFLRPLWQLASPHSGDTPPVASLPQLLHFLPRSINISFNHFLALSSLFPSTASAIFSTIFPFKRFLALSSSFTQKPFPQIFFIVIAVAMMAMISC